jgi:hypothetical protein
MQKTKTSLPRVFVDQFDLTLLTIWKIFPHCNLLQNSLSKTHSEIFEKEQSLTTIFQNLLPL